MRKDNPAPPGVDPQRFLDLSGGLLVVADFDGEIRWLTATFPLILGFDRDELIGSWFGDFVHPDDAEKVAERWERVLAGEDAVRFEYRTRTADGSYRSMLWSAVGVPEERQVYAAARDVTDLREAEGLYASAVANARLAMLIASVDPASLGRLTAVNPAASRFTGFSEEELLGRDFQSLMHPDDLEQGAAAGLLGVVAMTAFQRLVEMPVTGRKESYAPATLVEKLLPVAPKRRRERRRLNYAAHFGVGVSWGVGHGLIASRADLRGQRAVGAVFAALYGGDVIANTALGLYEPWRWSLQDWGVDLLDKLLLAEVAGLAFDRLRGSAGAQAT